MCEAYVSSPNPSRGVHVAEKAHGRSRSNHLKYQRWLVDLSWLTLEGGANKSRFMSTACLQPSRNLMLFRYCLSSTERRTGLRKIGMKKTSPMRLLEWTGMDAEISDIWNFRRRAKINLKTHTQTIWNNLVFIELTLYFVKAFKQEENVHVYFGTQK
jgi:hypothetical protein